MSCKFISNNCCTKGAGKTIFLSTTVPFPIFFLNKSSKYFSYKNEDSVLTLYTAYKHTHTQNHGGLIPVHCICNPSCLILNSKLWFKISSNENYAAAKAGNKILALPFLSCSPWLQPIECAIRKRIIEWDQIINGSNTSALYSCYPKQLSPPISVHKARNRTARIIHKVKEKISVGFATDHITENFLKESQSWESTWVPVIYHNADFYLDIISKISIL